MRKIWLVIVLLLIGSNLYAYRISRPQTFTFPLDEGQIVQLNEYLEQIWYQQQGLVDLDIVTTSKSAARNGEIWMIQTGSSVRMQFKANNHVYTITPEGF